MVYFLGVDAGGSHCRARLTDQDGHILGIAQSGPANAHIGIKALWSLLMNIVEETCKIAHLRNSDFQNLHVAFGIAGLSRPGFQAEIEAIASPFASVRYTGDDEIANIGAHQGKEGAILIIGTGSIAHIRLKGKNETLGGYGFPISDEASGAWLGLEALRYSLRSHDGRIEKSLLTESLMAEFSYNPSKIISWMDKAVPADYACFAPLVMEQGNRNDPIACLIIHQAVRYIENFITTIFEKGVVRCSLMGGLSGAFKPWLSSTISDKLTAAKGDALDGALILAGLEFSKIKNKIKPMV
ncbi:BadF/BadG/BcrA/BcrD ATPase family protein [Zymomonas mobilis]|uniref:ATPase BadF/BadG/BcrA/BcrD type n=1 Tax=Zymomonas mobilis subsp. pomaceae (strain ATCC 29192 / DSM 22645 / JCM 10191 / CCUG 17912 / NBRC 13757 / NCIMB 11200 / NRRL B-4491 / Barker I) TaxID=579138 RepID=F8ETM6_ZYMMT|nr:BadF/BadG/BcrA/BcrD ATPase family protein [Zymomonas mobilis]AEI37036.1 ATPase BadF/BadG/BcrA/BcrD type [Zymomonas mobilis subsp. pomaceae ATCC 29192]MDX5948408.1 BadF/BadG/BcrA/BcrD ATPase family protein [Zymomonas mobilis subsp. pomaceae]GEB89602.1 N-acetylglucosamine kinase [Zymomonas mobilis subsp. pomaceae]